MKRNLLTTLLLIVLPLLTIAQGASKITAEKGLEKKINKAFCSILPPGEMWLEDVVLFRPNVIPIFHAIYCRRVEESLPTPMKL